VVSTGTGRQYDADDGAASVDFFVSHAGPDRAWAEWVAWHLREAGVPLPTLPLRYTRWRTTERRTAH